MKAIYRIQEIQRALFQMRVDNGEYLKDIPYKKINPRLRRELYAEARRIYYNTNLDVKRVERGGVKVWRIVERGSV